MQLFYNQKLAKIKESSVKIRVPNVYAKFFKEPILGQIGTWVAFSSKTLLYELR